MLVLNYKDNKENDSNVLQSSYLHTYTHTKHKRKHDIEIVC